MDKGIFINNFENVINGQGTLIEYEFLDYYGNVFTSFSSNLNITITRNSTKHIDVISNSVTAGKGNFLYPFIGFINESYLVECKSPLYFKAEIFVKGCLPYQYYDNSSTCIYCPINYAYIGNSSISSGSISSSGDNETISSSCLKCDPNKLSCLFSSVSALEGYYLIDQDVTKVKECAPEMCLGNNTCLSEFSIGNLCFECIDQEGNQTIAKNGIRCCSTFKPILLLPILIIYLIFGLLLSLFKYTMFNKHSNIGSIIIFLQINSVVFFSYSGIYILPLFRMSIDMLDAVCYWPSLNYIQKSLISFSIIISLFLIGSTDITLKLIQFIYKKINNNNNNHIINHKFDDYYNQNSNTPTSSSIYPNFINFIIESKKDEIYNIKSRWSLFQIFIIPLVFNSISLMCYKKINNQYLLFVDFSITLNYSNAILIFISILILFIILLFLIILLFITLKSNSDINSGSNSSTGSGLLDRNQSIFNLILNFIKNFINKLYKLPKLFYYKKQFKWWDSIIIIKSILYSTLSITMLFDNNEYFFALIMSIQILYTTLYILISPIKKFASKDLNNISNLLELLILIFADSTLFRTIDLYHRGLSITIIIFTFTLFLILFDNIYLNKLNNGNHKKINNNNNNNNNNIYSKLPSSPIINNKNIN